MWRLPADAADALGSFVNARRRLELRGEAYGVKVYDDFAHHPTAILATLAALRSKVGGTARIIAVLEPRSPENGHLQGRSGAFSGACR
jgi:UDP-N-acetylmuramate: L-alanyl-gamma-D-glutamyl-meso-diaminopimelate ligase